MITKKVTIESEISIKDIAKRVISAHSRINSHIHKSALILSHPLSDLIGGKVYLKCENEQHTGSFKARGSLNKNDVTVRGRSRKRINHSLYG